MRHVISRKPVFSSTAAAIMRASLLAGTLDILAAFINTYIASGRGPEVVLKYIASGVWGSEGFSGGAVMMVYGLFFHYLIAFGWTTLYFVAYPQLRRLQRPGFVLSGIIYGMMVWAMMNYVILPLSNVPLPVISWGAAITGILIIIFAVGLPIAFSAERFYNKTKMRGEKAIS